MKDGLTYKEYIQRIATSGDRSAIRVKVADLRDNVARQGRSAAEKASMVTKRYLPALAVLEPLIGTQRTVAAEE